MMKFGLFSYIFLLFISLQLEAAEGDEWKTWAGEESSLEEAPRLSPEIIKYEERLVANTLWYNWPEREAREHIYSVYFTNMSTSEASFIYRASFGLSWFLEDPEKNYGMLDENRKNYTLRIKLKNKKNIPIILDKIKEIFPDYCISTTEQTRVLSNKRPLLTVVWVH